MTQKDEEMLSNTSETDDTPVVREDESETDIETQNTTEDEPTEIDNTDANDVENNLIDKVVVTVTRQSKLQITINILLIIAIGCALLFFVTDAGIYINQSTDTAYITTPVSEETLEETQQIIYVTDEFEPTLGTISNISTSTVTIHETNRQIDKGAIRGEPIQTVKLPVDV